MQLHQDNLQIIASFLQDEDLRQFCQVSKLYLLSAVYELVYRMKILRTHNMALDAQTVLVNYQNTLYGWGANNDGQLGIGTNKDSYKPVKIKALADKHIVNLVLRAKRSFAVSVSGEVYGWGDNDNGQLGLGHTEKCLIPQKLPMLTNISHIVASDYFAYAMTRTNDVYGWGSNSYGQLGLGHTETVKMPCKLESLAKLGIVAIIVSRHHTFALNQAGIVYAWGENSSGQLGLGHNENCHTPQQLGALQDKYITHLSTSNQHTLALTITGEVYAWGDNTYGQLGLGHKEDCLIPQKIELPVPIVAIVAREYYSLALAQTGDVYAWGRNNFHQLGFSIYALLKDRYTCIPQRIPDVVDKQLKHLIAFDKHTFALCQLRKLYAWGTDSCGEIRSGFAKGKLQVDAKLIQFLSAKVIKAFIASHEIAFALTEEDEVFVWGNNDAGGLGLGRNLPYRTFQKATGLTADLLKDCLQAHWQAYKHYHSFHFFYHLLNYQRLTAQAADTMDANQPTLNRKRKYEQLVSARSTEETATLSVANANQVRFFKANSEKVNLNLSNENNVLQSSSQQATKATDLSEHSIILG